jgi:predicted transposase YbfD/YdcC
VTLKDPRRRHLRRHRLLDIITIAICGVVAGADDWQQIATFGQRRRDWLGRFLALPHGIPAHDTFERVFDRLDPQAFQACFRQWTGALAQALGVRQLAIDGKTLRGSRAPGRDALHLVGVWAGANHLLLGQVAVADKSNEITAIPKLLELLDLHGALVTLDALGCQKEIAAKIVAGGGDYLLLVKDNQPTLLADLQESFARALDTDFAGLDHDRWTSAGHGHGRQEKRCYYVIRNPHGLRQETAWAGLRVIGLCYSERTVGEQTSMEIRYFIGSKAAGARYYGKALRNHWGIENNLHWQLDITFGEDASRVSRRHEAENLALVRRLALILLKRHPAQQSIACKRLAAALDTDFLEEILRSNGDSEKP